MLTSLTHSTAKSAVISSLRGGEGPSQEDWELVCPLWWVGSWEGWFHHRQTVRWTRESGDSLTGELGVELQVGG